MASATPVPEVGARIVFLRPKDRDDGSNGGTARIDVNRVRVGQLRFGGFLYVDVEPGTTVLTAFGRYRAFGSCEIEIAAAPGSTIFVDVGPRMSYMVASAIGGTVGGIAGAAAAPDVYGSVGAAMATGPAAMATGSAAGESVAVAAEARGRPCRGPYKLDIVTEEEVAPRLAGLGLSTN